MKIILAIAILIGLGVLAVVLYGRERLWERLGGPADIGRYDFAEAKRNATPNDALACTAGTCTAPDLTIPDTAGPPAAVVKRLSERLATIEAHVRRVEDRSDPGYARFVVYTPLLRFPDTIDVEVRERAGGSSDIRAYSRSKLGRSDFGTNKKRLAQLFDVR